MNILSKLKNYWNKPVTQYFYKDYVVLLKNFTFDDERQTTQIFSELKNSGISIVASNAESNNWHFLVSLKQRDQSDHSDEVKTLLSLIFAKYNLQVMSVWPDNEKPI